MHALSHVSPHSNPLLTGQLADCKLKKAKATYIIHHPSSRTEKVNPGTKPGQRGTGDFTDMYQRHVVGIQACLDSALAQFTPSLRVHAALSSAAAMVCELLQACLTRDEKRGTRKVIHHLAAKLAAFGPSTALVPDRALQASTTHQPTS